MIKRIVKKLLRGIIRLVPPRVAVTAGLVPLYAAALAARRANRAKRQGEPRSVAHVSPAYFSDQSYIGGGERYATCLAEALAADVPTVLVSFGAERKSFRQGALRVEVYPKTARLGRRSLPSLGFLREVSRADVVHCHQYWTPTTTLILFAAAFLGKRVFVSDLGGATYFLAKQIPLHNLVDGFLPISAFGAAMMPPGVPSKIIYGGVEPQFLEPVPEPAHTGGALYAGRLLPHKGINYLIEGLPPNVPLELVGRVYDPKYFALLQELAQGKAVTFHTQASDQELIASYRRARVGILASVYDDVYGVHYDMPELLGLVLLESMACGTPVICTDVGAMPEFVEEGVTGFIVPPNNPRALGEKVALLVNDPALSRRMGEAGRARVAQLYSWPAVARRCLDAYRNSPGNA